NSTGTFKAMLDTITLQYKGSGRYLQRDEDAGRIVIEASGKDRRGNGTAGATVTAVLTEAGEGTAVDVVTEMDIGGKPAQFGRGMIQSISNKMLDKFLTCIREKMTDSA